MKAVICEVCNGHKELVLPVMEVVDGQPRLIYKRFPCTACGGTGIRYVQDDKKGAK